MDSRKEDPNVTKPQSQSIQVNWQKNLQIYFIINNLSTLCVFILLSKCLYSLYPSITAIILFIASYTFVTVFSISSIYFSPPSPATATKTATKYELVEYIKNTPLCYVTFYYFTRLSCLKSTNSFDYHLLLLSTVYLSVQTIVNCILIDIKPCSLLKTRFVNMFFLFLFRYFAFVAKLISTVLVFSTLTDSNFVAVLRSSSEFEWLELTLTKNVYWLSALFIASSFGLYFGWYLVKFRNSTRRRNNLLRAAFESYKMLIEYNEKLLDQRSTRISFMFVQFVIHIIAAYVWYYRAVVVLAKARAKTTLIGLLTKYNHLKILVDLYELEEKLTTRQFELVCVLGSVLIAYLAQYIYYAYYEIGHAMVNSDKTESTSNRRTIELRGRYVNSGFGRPLVLRADNEYGCESKMSSSISSWVASTASTSSSSGIFNIYNNYNHKQMDCSTCCTSIDRHIFDDVFADSIVSSDTNPQLDHLMSRKFLGLDYESSSGVASSATSTSISSIYNEFSNWNQPESQSTAVKNFLDANRNITVNGIYDKVLTWIKNTEKCTVGQTVEAPKCVIQQNWGKNSAFNVANSFVNTDSTLKTDQSNFTYFI